MTSEVAIFGGGCFWCLEACYLEVEGVISVESGYCGGEVPNPSYEQICGGGTGHAEVVRVEFDPQRVGYGDLLEIFFSIHDPTTRDRQGHDVGTQYRSVIFWLNEAQRATAQEWVDRLNAERVFDRPVVTELSPAVLAGAPSVAGAHRYYAGEPYHQRYFERHPGEGYCRMVVAPKLAGFRRRHKARLRP